MLSLLIIATHKIYLCATPVLFVIGDCDWLSPCTMGVCFANDTGCPVSGTHLLKHTETDETISNEGESENHDWKQGYPPFVTALLAFAGMIISVIFGCVVIRRERYVFFLTPCR